MKFRRALFIYPYYREVPVYGFFPPLGLEYVQTAVDDLLEWSTLLDFRWEVDLEKTFREIMAEGVDLICVSVNWHYEYESVCEIIRALPNDVTTVVGGTHATQNVEELFHDCENIDVVVRGDGEETLREFVEKGSPEGVAGLSHRSGGSVVHNDNRLLKPVSDVQYPDRTKRRYNYRATYQKVDLGYSFDTMVASRGCPYNCKFCSFKRNPLGQKRAYSERPPESVIEELKKIDAKLVAFLDDNFFVNIKRAERICDLIIQENLNKIFIVNARINIAFHPRLLKKMHRAGFRLLMIGIESAQDKSLKSLSKGFDTAKARKAFEVLRKSNMMTGGYFIVGLIGETKDEMLEIGTFATELGVDFIHLNRLRFEKYSGLQDLLDGNDDYYVGDKSRIYSRKYGPKEINAILKTIRNKFFNPGKIMFLAHKGVRIGFPGWPILLRAVVNLPRIVFRLIRRKKIRRMGGAGPILRALSGAGPPS